MFNYLDAVRLFHFFPQIMGHMDVIPIISDGFNIYFPIMIVLLCICTYFSLGSRILHFLGINQFIGDDDLTQELVDEGKEIVKRGKTFNISLEMTSYAPTNAGKRVTPKIVNVRNKQYTKDSVF